MRELAAGRSVDAIMNHATDPKREGRLGMLACTVAFVIWGLVPLFWKQLHAVDAVELIAHRIVWSCVFLFLIMPFRQSWAQLRAAWKTPVELRLHLATGALILVNWLIYIWAVNAGRVVDASLGYFLNPLVNVLLGRWFLREKLGPVQLAAVALAGVGVAILVGLAGTVPWIALGLAVSFGVYGLLKKRSSLGPMAGLTFETTLYAPFSAGWLAWLALDGRGALGHADDKSQVLILCTGVLTAIPLLLFAVGARRLPLATVGLLQYTAPTLQFFLGVWFYGEQLTPARMAAFGCIWVALAIYSANTLMRARAASRR